MNTYKVITISEGAAGMRSQIEGLANLISDSYENYDLKLKFSNNIISIGSSSENYKMIELYTNFDVSFIEDKELYYIPKIIVQTNKNICKNLYHYNSVISLLEKNPNYNYIYFDDIDSSG